MNTRLDDQIRQLMQRVVDESPPPPDTPNSPIFAPVTSRRVPNWAFAMGAAVVVLVLIGGGAWLFGSNGTDVAVQPAPSTTGARVDSTTTTTVETIPTAPVATTTTGAQAPDRPRTDSERVGPPRPFTPPVMYPPAGLILMVVGIEHDGGLNVRQGPGLTPIVTTLGPTDRVQAGGEVRELASTTWWSVDAEGTIGWVEARYLTSWVSAKYDLTSTVTETIDDVHFDVLDDGEPVVTAPTMEELGRLVAATFVVDGYPLRVAMAIAPTADDSGLATFDVVSDDTLGLGIAVTGLEGQTGWRLRVSGRAHNGAFILTEVEGRPLLHACAC